jgi:AAA+ ATPase superfamily predicted ATPase
MKFLGREEELKLLEEKYRSNKSELIVIYGRRRVGKSALVENFLQSKKLVYRFEGLENEKNSVQIEEFIKEISIQLKDQFLMQTKFQSWSEVFEFLTQRVFSQAGRKIIFLDEFQWMATGHSKIVSLLKSYWDRHWSKQDVMLILCGSVASFMINKVINSKALYGRINSQILLKQLDPSVAAKFFKGKRSKEEILLYLMLFGGIPKYLEEIDLNKSIKQNINALCFSPRGFLFNEADKIFYNQFRETKIYIRIVKLLKDQACTFNEVSQKLQMVSGGGLKLYLSNLEQAEIIRSYTSYDMSQTSKFRKYRLSDEYLIFYYKFIEPNLEHISESNSKNLFSTLVEKTWDPWLGFSFERFCLKNAYYLADKMNFADEVIHAASFYGKGDSKFQIDLIYKRSDKVLTICEIKYQDSPISSKIIPEFERKLALLEKPKGFSIEKALISLYGADKSLKDAEYFNHILSLEDIL